MDSDNVNYNTVVHKWFSKQKKDILIRAWAQTLSACPRNKKKSRETDSSPGGVGCWGHWEVQGGAVMSQFQTPMLEWGLWSSVFLVRRLPAGFFQGVAMGEALTRGEGAVAGYGPSSNPALAVTSISLSLSQKPAHCSLPKVWTQAGHIPANRKRVTEYYCYVCQDLWKQMEGGNSRKAQPIKTGYKNRRAWLVLGADESVIRNFLKGNPRSGCLHQWISLEL